MSYDQNTPSEVQPLKMTIVRTNPEQGKLVTVYFYSEPLNADPLTSDETPLGRIVTDYEHWLQLEKLLRDGMDRRAREGNTRLVITFRPIEVKIKEVDGSTTESSPDHSVLISTLAKDDDEGIRD